MKTHETGIKEETFTCSVCGNVYTNNKCLKHHMKYKHPRRDIIVNESVGFMVLAEEVISNTQTFVVLI